MRQDHTLDGLLSERDKRRVYGPAQFSRQRIGLSTWERARVSNYMIQYVTIESLAIRIFFPLCGGQAVMEKQVVGFDNSME